MAFVESASGGWRLKRINLLLWFLLLLFASGAWTAEDLWIENMTEEQYRAADVDNDGELTFEEYDNWRMQQFEYYRRHAYDIFNVLDEDGDGLISVQEISAGSSVPEDNAHPSGPMPQE